MTEDFGTIFVIRRGKFVRALRRVLFCRVGMHDLRAVDMDPDTNPWNPGRMWEFVWCPDCLHRMPFEPFGPDDD